MCKDIPDSNALLQKLCLSECRVISLSSPALSLAVLKDLNQQALALQKEDKKAPAPHYRFRLGSYLYTDLDDE